MKIVFNESVIKLAKEHMLLNIVEPVKLFPKYNLRK